MREAFAAVTGAGAAAGFAGFGKTSGLSSESDPPPASGLGAVDAPCPAGGMRTGTGTCTSAQLNLTKQDDKLPSQLLSHVQQGFGWIKIIKH